LIRAFISKQLADNQLAYKCGWRDRQPHLIQQRRIQRSDVMELAMSALPSDCVKTRASQERAELFSQ
jgi:hypothetical protein